MPRLAGWWLLAALFFLALPVSLHAQAEQASITSPRPNAIVRGAVSIQGVATHPNFWKYEVWVAPGLNPGDGAWSVINVQENIPIVTDGQLAVWNTLAFPDGVYSIKLRVVRLDGNYDDFDVSPINVANTVPTAPPATNTPQPTNTPSPTDTPEATPTPEFTATPVLTPTIPATATALSPSPTATPTGPVPTLTPSGPPPTLPPFPTLTSVPTLASPTVVTIEQPRPTPSITVTPPPAVAVETTATTPQTPRRSPGLDLQLGLDTSNLFSACFVGMGLTLVIFLFLGLLALLRQVVRWMV